MKEPLLSALSDHPKIYTRDRWWVLGAVAVNVLMGTLDAGIVNIALPTLALSFHASFAAVQWVVVGYGLVLTSLMLIAARLGDMYSKRRLFIIGVVVFAAASLFAGLSPSIEFLIALRVLQALGAVLTQSLGSAILTEVFPKNERGKALGIMGGTVSIGLALGPGLGGLIIAAVGWRAMFLVNVPVGIVAAIIAVKKLPVSAPARIPRRFDFLGATALFVALSAYAAAMTGTAEAGFRSWTAAVLFAITAVFISLFSVVETRTKEPMLDPSLFRNKLFTTNLVMGFFMFVALSAGFILPFFLQIAKGLSPVHVGMLMMVQPVAMGLVAPFAGALSDKLGSRGISFFGLAIAAAGCVAISRINADAGPVEFAVQVAIVGVGVGLFQSPNNSAIMGAAPRDRLGASSGLLALSRTLGHATGLPLMGAVFSTAIPLGVSESLKDFGQLSPNAVASGVRITYAVAAAVVLATALLSAAVWISERRRKASPMKGS